jgi:6-phosphofructokinase 1
MGVTALVAHSGGPTAVINASLVGLIQEARRHAAITGLLGARHGVDGILEEDFVDLFAQAPERLEAVAQAPSSALGTSRRALTDADLDRSFGASQTHVVCSQQGNDRWAPRADLPNAHA